MKTKIKLVFAALLMLAAFRSQAQCSAQFVIQPQTGGVVSFYEDSANIGLPVQWNFGDGDTSSSTGWVVTHTYTQNGTYTICATVTNAQISCTNTYCDSVVINLCGSLAFFNYTQTGFGVYSFVNYTSTPTTSWNWSFGDGGTSTSISPAHNYAASGTYTVSLIVTDTAGGCSDTSTQSLIVSLCSFANSFTSDSPSGDPNTFIVNSPLLGYTYTWHFGDGTTASGDSLSHQFTYAGNYTNCLLTSDNVTGCTDSTCQTAYADPCGIYAGINENSNGLIASYSVGFGYQSTSHSGLTYSWGFPGGSPSSSTSASPVVNYSSIGTYSATLIATNASSCSDTITQSVSITSSQSFFAISGTIYEGNSGSCGTIYLITQDTIGHLSLLDSIVNIDTLINGVPSNQCSGTYEFFNLPVDTYYVKAALNLNDPDYADYLPTYYGDVLHWSDATPVILSNSNATANIDLTLGNNPGGPGFVSGWISQGAGLVLQQGNNITRGGGSFLAGVQVNLLTSDNTPVAYTYSDANGQFKFNNLQYNSYHIYVERLNIMETPTNFTLSAQNPGDTTLSITVDSNTATSISNVNNISVNGIFPNPVSTVVDIEISSQITADATLTLNDMLGQAVATQKLHLVTGLNKGEINMANLAAGVYQIVLQSNNERLTYKVVKAR